MQLSSTGLNFETSTTSKYVYKWRGQFATIGDDTYYDLKISILKQLYLKNVAKIIKLI